MPHLAPTTVSAATSWTSSSSSSSSSRWCPTPEQLMILEEMYRMGIHTPNASQIQQITAQLSSYGKIEGKNVFYWFQNHKARDRQRLRRKFSRQLHLGQHYRHNHHPFCFQLPPNPQQQHQIFNHQHYYCQFVDEQSLSSRSPGAANCQHCACCSPNSFLQGGTMGSKRFMRGTSHEDWVEGDKAGTMRRRGLLDGMLAADVLPPPSPATQTPRSLPHHRDQSRGRMRSSTVQSSSGVILGFVGSLCWCVVLLIVILGAFELFVLSLLLFYDKETKQL